jgi:hypothetical protein
LVDILVSALPARTELPAGKVLELKKNAFNAILDQEEQRLKRVKPLIRELRSEIAAISPSQGS